MHGGFRCLPNSLWCPPARLTVIFPIQPTNEFSALPIRLFVIDSLTAGCACHDTRVQSIPHCQSCASLANTPRYNRTLGAFASWREIGRAWLAQPRSDHGSERSRKCWIGAG